MRRRTAGSTASQFGIYSSAMNGFFSTWGAFFTSLYLCYVSWFGEATPDAKDPKVFLVIIFFASIFEMWAAATFCSRLNDSYSSCKDQVAWAVAVGTISAFICLVMGILFCAAAELANTANKFVAAFLFVLWIFGTGVTTFDYPFTSACGVGGLGSGAWSLGYIGYTDNSANGYFASWICFCVSFAYMYMSIPQIAQAASKIPAQAGPLLMCLILASIVVLVQSSVRCSKNYQGACTTVQAWAVACSVISIVFSVLCVVPLLTQFVKYIALFLMCLWFCAVATFTYTYKDATSDLGLYASSDNGFFGTWAAFFFAIMLCYVEGLGGSVEELTDGGASNAKV